MGAHAGDTDDGNGDGIYFQPPKCFSIRKSTFLEQAGTKIDPMDAHDGVVFQPLVNIAAGTPLMRFGETLIPQKIMEKEMDACLACISISRTRIGNSRLHWACPVHHNTMITGAIPRGNRKSFFPRYYLDGGKKCKSLKANHNDVDPNVATVTLNLGGGVPVVVMYTLVAMKAGETYELTYNYNVQAAGSNKKCDQGKKKRKKAPRDSDKSSDVKSKKQKQK